MKIDPKLYTHSSDEAALEALQSIPVFPKLLKAFMKIWNEKQYMLQNMSSNLRLGKDQLPKYYDMLLPICEKMSIDVPDLYLESKGTPNAYTCGDTKPCIVMTAGLVRKFPDEIVKTVLAHECGHIACHHGLYHTMGNMLLNSGLSGLNFLGLNDLASLASTPLKIAFFHWMRCSEFSADRAAAVCDGHAENIVKMCMFFAGYSEKTFKKSNIDAFMNQAVEYKNMVDESKWNKTLEFLMFNEHTHPLVALRAYECAEWAKSEEFKNIIDFSECKSIEENSSIKLPFTENPNIYIGKNYKLVSSALAKKGFQNISLDKREEPEKLKIPGTVISVCTDEEKLLSKGMWLPADSNIRITYLDENYAPKAIEQPEENATSAADGAKKQNSQDPFASLKAWGTKAIDSLQIKK